MSSRRASFLFSTGDFRFGRVALRVCAFLVASSLVFVSCPASGQTPTPTPTPPPFDLKVSNVILGTQTLVNSIPGSLILYGGFDVQVNNPDLLMGETEFEFLLMDSGFVNTYFSHTTEIPAADVLVGTVLFNFPLDPGINLPVQDYVLRVTADPNGLYDEPDTANNVADSPPQQIVHVSGNVFFDTVLTTITAVFSLGGSPLKLDGTGDLAGLPITYSGLEVTRDNFLDLHVVSGTIPFDFGTEPVLAGNWSYLLTNGSLGPSGAQADVSVVLPPEMSYRENPNTYLHTTNPIFLGFALPLDANLAPVGEVILNVPRFFHWEGLPLYFIGASQIFSDADGFTLAGIRYAVYYQTPRFFASPGPRPANDGYFHNELSELAFSGRMYIRHDGFDGTLVSDGQFYRPSFPLGFGFSFISSEIRISQSRIVAGGSRLNGVFMSFFYDGAACPGGGGSPIGLGASQADLRSDGSVFIEPAYADATPRDYEFNTYTIYNIQPYHYYQPGYMVREDTPTSKKDAIDEYLLSPIDAAAGDLHYYGTAPFVAGEGIYQGVTLERELLDGATAEVSIDSSPSNPLSLTLNSGSKVYARASGFSGTIDAGSIGVGIELYPDFTRCPADPYYDVLIDTFGQAFLSNDPTGFDSKIDGSVYIPFPSDITIPFDDMLLNGCGNFEGGNIPEEVQNETRTLVHWLAKLKLQTVSFDLKTPASPDEDRTLWISSVNPIAHLSKDALMQINLLPCGDIGNSRVSEPIAATLDEYDVSVQDIYLTRFDPVRPAGFYNLVGQLHFPFFGASAYQAIVKADSLFVADGRPWESIPDPDGNDNGFVDTFIPDDPDPDGQVTEYSQEELVFVDKLFANIIDLGYDLEYDRTKKEYFSPETNLEDLIVVSADSSVKYLDTERTEIEFGARFTDFPKLALSSIASEFSSEVQNTFLIPVRDKLEDAGALLNGDLTQPMRQPLKDLLRPAVADFVQDLQVAVAAKDPGVPLNTFLSTWVPANLPAMVTDLKLVTRLRGPQNPAYNIIDGLVTDLTSVRNDLAFTPVALNGLIGAVVNDVLDALGLSTSFNLSDVIGPAEDLRQSVIAILDEDIEPVLNDATLLFGDPETVKAVFPSSGIASLETQIETDLSPYLIGLDLPAVQNLDPDSLTNIILNVMFNDSMFSDLDNLVMVELFPIKDRLLDLSQAVLDGVNDVVEDYVNDAAGWVSKKVSEFHDILGMKGAEMKGNAVIAGDVMEKIHIDLSVILTIPDDFKFKAFLDMKRYQVSQLAENCLISLDGTEIMDVQIGASGVPLDIPWGDGLTADVEMSLMIKDGALANVGGSVDTDGKIRFESLIFEDLGLGLAVGEIENYLWAKGKVRFESASGNGGIFLGTSCDLEPLKKVDSKVATFLDVPKLRGVYARYGGSFPIFDVGCLLRVAAEAGQGWWVFADGPSYGGLMVGGFYGRLGCVVNARGRMRLIGGKSGSSYFFNGTGWVAGGVGHCDPGGWDSPSDVWDDSWCYTCVAYLDVTYHNGWGVGYDVDCE